MKKNISWSLRVTWRKMILILIPALLTLANIPQRGLSEGGQGGLPKLSDKVDFWGSALPILTRDELTRTSMLLSVFSLSLYWAGFVLVITSNQVTNIRFVILTILGSIGAIFAQQNLRDAFLLSFSMLSFGLLDKFVTSKVNAFRYSFIIPLIFAVTFKYPTSIAITLLFLFRFYTRTSLSHARKIISFLLASGLIILIGISVDKSLARAVSLERGFVEQSVMYYDLASFYCWSDDPKTRAIALNALQQSIVTKDSKEICLTHRPNAWIYLVSGGNFSNQGVVAPLRQLSGSEDQKNARLLGIGWLKTISYDPVEYIQIKLTAATQILTVGNPFLFAQLGLNDQRFPGNMSNYVWLPISFILILIGKTYLFSIFAQIILLSSLRLSGSFDYRYRSSINFLIFVHVVNWGVLSIFYVSDEARYVFPIIILSYLILVKDFQFSRIKKG
jgi:hypothetical protein